MSFGKIERTNRVSNVVLVSETGIMHPDYNSENGNNDIGLIYTPEEIPLGHSIQTIRLPTYYEQNKTFSGVTAIISGWGSVAKGYYKYSRYIFNYLKNYLHF